MKKVYEVAPGVVEINGVRVPDNRRMTLTDAEALYDLSRGRLFEVSPRKVPRARGKPKAKP